jgi:hypothetical protein
MVADFETVYTVTDFWDGIRAGIADFNGVPHYYERLDEQREEHEDDWVDLFLLKRIDEETFRLAIEDWDIWKRWYIACQTGETTVETHPALPKDRTRHTEITKILTERLVVNPGLDVKAQAEFERDYRNIHPTHATNPMAKIKVKWQVIS